MAQVRLPDLQSYHTRLDSPMELSPLYALASEQRHCILNVYRLYIYTHTMSLAQTQTLYILYFNIFI